MIIWLNFSVQYLKLKLSNSIKELARKEQLKQFYQHTYFMINNNHCGSLDNNGKSEIRQILSYMVHTSPECQLQHCL